MANDTLIEFTHTNEALNRYAEELRNAYIEQMASHNRAASGTLANSVKVEVRGNLGGWDVVVNLEDYWKYIENDTQPHFPPFHVIREWVEVKPIIPTPRNGKLPTLDQLAHAIQWKIAQAGTKGTHDLENAVKDVNSQFLESVSQAVYEDLQNDVNISLITAWSK